MDVSNHFLDAIVDAEDGFYQPRCACGWLGPPGPDHEDAANFWGQHLVAQIGVT